MTDLPDRKKIRLKNWDYSSGGGYFITICTKDRKHILSTICVGGGILDAPQVELTKYGETVKNQFEIINELYKDIEVIHYVIMPNHIHFIIEIKTGGRPGGRPLREVIPLFQIMLAHSNDLQIKNGILIYGSVPITTT